MTHDAGGRPITGLQDTRTDIAGTAERCRVGAAEISDCMVQATHHRDDPSLNCNCCGRTAAEELRRGVGALPQVGRRDCGLVLPIKCWLINLCSSGQVRVAHCGAGRPPHL